MFGLLSPYILFLQFLLLLVYPYQQVSKNGKRGIMYLCFIVFVLFFGLRGNIGDDYNAYLNFYQHPNLSHALVFGPGYSLLSWLFSILHTPFQCFILLLAILTNALLMRFAINIKANLPFVLAVYISMDGIVNQINFVRNIISILLFANSIEYIGKRNAKYYFSLNLIGFLFHYSAILYLPLYYFGHIMPKRKICWIVLVTGAFVLPLHLPLLNWCVTLTDHTNISYATHLSEYIDNPNSIKLNYSLSAIERLITGTLICLFHDKLSRNIYSRVASNGFLLYYIYHCLLSDYALLATRLANTLICCHWILWPLIITYANKKKTKVVIASWMFLYMICKLSYLSFLKQWQYNLYV